MERRARERAEQAPAEGRGLGAGLRAATDRGGPEGSLAPGCLHRGCVQGPLGLGDDPHLLGAESAVTSLEGLGDRRCAQAAIARPRMANVTAPPQAQGVVPVGPELVNDGGALL